MENETFQPISLEHLFDPSAPAHPEPSASETPATGPQEVAEPVEPVGEGEAPAPGETPVAAETGEEPPAAPVIPGRTPKAPKQDAPPASDDDELPRDVKGLRAATKAERTKRQAVESKIAEYEARFADQDRRLQEADLNQRQLAAYLQGLDAERRGTTQQRQPQQPQQPPQRPDPVIDPEGALAYERALHQQALQQLGGQFHQELYATRVIQGQRAMRSQVQDYDQMEAIATQAAQADPELRQQILTHPDPAGFTYDVGRRIKLNYDIQNSGGWDAYYRNQVNAEVERQLAARMAQVQPPAAPPAPTSSPTVPVAAQPHGRSAPSAPPPQSLASVPSAAPRNRAPAYTGPTPLEDILKQ